jgi:predicted Zn-dependent protease with MMP-like domain
MDVPPDVRSQFQGNVISFKQTLSNDIEALSKMGIEEPEKVLDLKPREYHIFGELPKRININ